MHDTEVARMIAIDHSYWWYSALHKYIHKRIGSLLNNKSAVLDLGCGSGLLLARIKKEYQCQVLGIDSSLVAITAAKEKGVDAQQADMLSAVKSAENASLDLILSIDTLYFLSKDNQIELIKAALHKLKKNGLMIIHLPAGKVFQREHDATVSISDRYNRAQLTALMENLQKSTGLIDRFFLRQRVFLLSPGILVKKMLQKINPSSASRSDLQPLPNIVNFIFRLIQQAEDRLLAPPFGSSIYLEIRKN